jgi:hypothetical protein
MHFFLVNGVKIHQPSIRMYNTVNSRCCAGSTKGCTVGIADGASGQSSLCLSSPLICCPLEQSPLAPNVQFQRLCSLLLHITLLCCSQSRSSQSSRGAAFPRHIQRWRQSRDCSHPRNAAQAIRIVRWRGCTRQPSELFSMESCICSSSGRQWSRSLRSQSSSIEFCQRLSLPPQDCWKWLRAQQR